MWPRMLIGFAKFPGHSMPHSDESPPTEISPVYHPGEADTAFHGIGAHLLREFPLIWSEATVPPPIDPTSPGFGG